MCACVDNTWNANGGGDRKTPNTLFEWQTDELAAAAANQQLEGDDSMNALAVAEPVRLTNVCQISFHIFVLCFFTTEV